MLRTPKAKCLFIATTRGAAEELFWNPWKDMIEQLGIDAKFNETKLHCTFRKNGARIRLVGADDKREIEKLRGLPHHEVGIDEGASYKPQLIDHLLFRILGPRMGDFENSTIWIIGTPSHVLSGPFYAATLAGYKGDDGLLTSRPWEDRELPEFENWERWSAHYWSLQDGAKTVPAMARLWQEALREKEANGWSDENPVWQREYQGRWAADDTQNVFRYRPHEEDGTEHNQWNPKKDPRGFAELPYEAEWNYVYGMDMGHSDPFALQVFAWDPHDPKKMLYHVYEFARTKLYAKLIASLLIGEDLDAENPKGVMGKTGWPNGMVADIAGLGGAVLEELASVYGIRVKEAKKRDKHDSIELFNGDLLDGKLKILKGSTLEEQLLSLQWDTDDYGNLKEHKGMRNDCTDAAIYARREAQHLFTQEAPTAIPLIPRRKEYNPDDDDLDLDSSDGEFDSILSDGMFNDGLWG
jgi:hypothetical protein